MTDLVIINPAAAREVYGPLGDDLIAIEPPLWARLIAGYIRDQGFSVEIIDAEAERLTAYVSLPPPQRFAQVLVLGMGGSAIAGDLAADLFLKQANAPIIPWRNYNLPEYVSPDTLVCALSYSGDTEETLAARILVEEHKIYPEAVRLYFEGRLEVRGRRVRIRD